MITFMCVEYTCRLPFREITVNNSQRFSVLCRSHDRSLMTTPPHPLPFTILICICVHGIVLLVNNYFVFVNGNISLKHILNCLCEALTSSCFICFGCCDDDRSTWSGVFYTYSSVCVCAHACVCMSACMCGMCVCERECV